MKEGKLREKLMDVFGRDRRQVETILQQVDRARLIAILSAEKGIDRSLSNTERKRAKRLQQGITKQAVLALLKSPAIGTIATEIADSVRQSILRAQDEIAEPIAMSWSDSLIVNNLAADPRIPQDQRKILLEIDGCPDELHDLVGILQRLIKKYSLSGSEQEQYYQAWQLHRLLLTYKVTQQIPQMKKKGATLPAVFETVASDQAVELFPTNMREQLALMAKIDQGPVDPQDVIALLKATVDSAQHAMIDSLTATVEEALKFVDDLSLVIVTLYGQDNPTDDGRLNLGSRSEAYQLAWQVRWLQRDHRDSIKPTPVARGKYAAEPLRITPVDLMPPSSHLDSGKQPVAPAQASTAVTATPRVVPATKGVARRPHTRSLWTSVALLAVAAIAGKPKEDYATSTHLVMENHSQTQGKNDKPSLPAEREHGRIARSLAAREISLEQCSVSSFSDRSEDRFYISNALPSGINQCIQGGAQSVLQNAFGINDAQVLQVVGSLAERAIRDARPSAVHTNQGDQVALAYNQSTGQWTVRQNRGGRPLVVAYFSYPLSTPTVLTQPSAYFGSNFFNKISSKMQQAWHSFKSWWV